MPTRKNTRCSFCQKHSSRVQHLFRGKKDHLICDLCIWLCVEVLEHRKEGRAILVVGDPKRLTFSMSLEVYASLRENVLDSWRRKVTPFLIFTPSMDTELKDERWDMGPQILFVAYESDSLSRKARRIELFGKPLYVHQAAMRKLRGKTLVFEERKVTTSKGRKHTARVMTATSNS